MPLICFASQKGSPGTTVTSLAVAAAMKVEDGRRKLLLEADGAGGILAIRYRLPVEPGLVTLAAAVRAGMDSDELWRHSQELPGGLSVVLCPDGPDQVHAALSASGAALGHFLNGLADVDVICDIGRLSADSPGLALAAEASALLMVARPSAEQLQPAARRLQSLKPRVGNVGWVLVGQKPYGPADVEATFGLPVVGLMADDERSVLAIEQGGISKRLRRQPFVRSAATLASTLSDWLAPITAPSSAANGAAAEPAAVVDPGAAAMATPPPPPPETALPPVGPAEPAPAPAPAPASSSPPPSSWPEPSTPASMPSSAPPVLAAMPPPPPPESATAQVPRPGSAPSLQPAPWTEPEVSSIAQTESPPVPPPSAALPPAAADASPKPPASADASPPAPAGPKPVKHRPVINPGSVPAPQTVPIPPAGSIQLPGPGPAPLGPPLPPPSPDTAKVIEADTEPEEEPYAEPVGELVWSVAEDTQLGDAWASVDDESGGDDDWPLGDEVGLSQSWPERLDPVPDMNGWSVEEDGGPDPDGEGAQDIDDDIDDVLDDVDDELDDDDGEAFTAFTVTADLVQVFGEVPAPTESPAAPPTPPPDQKIPAPAPAPAENADVAVDVDAAAVASVEGDQADDDEAGHNGVEQVAVIRQAPPMPPASLSVQAEGPKPPSAFPHGEDDVEWAAP